MDDLIFQSSEESKSDISITMKTNTNSDSSNAHLFGHPETSQTYLNFYKMLPQNYNSAL